MKFYFIVFFLITPFIVQGQNGLIVTDTLNNSGVGIANLLSGKGVVIDNVMINCHNASYGKFIGTQSNLGLDSGMVITNGSAKNAKGPNNIGAASLITGMLGDPDLDSLIPGYFTLDACVIEFDVTPLSDTLQFNYVFGSEEYPEWVDSIYNDVFGFFISGPGINGIQNIALIPGTNTPVAINNVNNIQNAQYFIDNGDGSTPPQYNDPYYIQYDGFTTKFIAKVKVTPCQTYHLKLAIADAGDQVLDSGIFLESNSFESNSYRIMGSSFSVPGSTELIEGCNDGYFTIYSKYATTSSKSIDISIGGTATNGIDFNYIPDSLIIPQGDTAVTFNISVIADSLTEAKESVVIYLWNDCFPYAIDSVEFHISDHFSIDAIEDTAICKGDTIQLSANNANNYSWLPIVEISNPFIANPYVYPSATESYIVKGELNNCIDFDTVLITVKSSPVITAGNDTSICFGDSVHLNASGGISYTWTPPYGLTASNIPDPIATPVYTIKYTVLGLGTNGCIGADTIHLQVNSLPKVETIEDTIICGPHTLSLKVTGALSYVWSPVTFFLDTISSSPVISPTSTITYTVTGTDNNGCQNQDVVTIYYSDIPILDAGGDTTIFLGTSVKLNGMSSASGFNWMPDIWLDNSAALNPISSPEKSISYYLKVTDTNGCEAIDSVHIEVIEEISVVIPNIFSPNGDGLNDFLNVLSTGPVEVEYFKIFNRWGEVIYENNTNEIIKNTYSNFNSGWDGMYKGKDAPSGVYAYVFRGTSSGKTILLTGNVTLIR